MKLRARLLVTTVAFVAPIIAGVIWIDAWQRHAAAKDELENLALSEMLRGERARCEADPAHWGGRPLPPPEGRDHPHPPPGPPPRGNMGPPPAGPRGSRPPRDMRGEGRAPPVLHAYDAHRRSLNPRAPPLAMHGGALWPGRNVEALVKMPWESGPCVYVLARGSSDPGVLDVFVPKSPVWIVPIGAAILGFLLSAAPIVRRLTRLSIAVRRAAEQGFTEPVAIEGEDEITELARAFDSASAAVRLRLEEKDERERTLREYLASTTHDVMIPLTVLKAHLTTIHEQRAAGEHVDPAVIAQAMNEAHYLGALMHNLGVTAKLDTSEASITRLPVDLCALVERVLARHRPVARQASVSIEGAVPETTLEVLGDVTLLEQAVNNVVYNSIRYNRAGGSVGITLDRLAGDRFRLRVVDDGPGIPEEQMSRLVERGFRGNDARTRAPEGQGIGLAIAFRVARALDITLTFARGESSGLEVDFVGDAITHGSRHGA